MAGWILELDRGLGIPWQGTTAPGWSRRKPGSRAKRSPKRFVRLWRTSSNGSAESKARQAKSKARLQRYEKLSSKEFQERNETNEIYIPPGERLGDLVVEAKGLRKAYGDRLLIDNLTFNLPRGGIVGIIGPNGAGKTTLVPYAHRRREAR